nr:hypothetical protein [Streptomyces sp. ISL-94]
MTATSGIRRARWPRPESPSYSPRRIGEQQQPGGLQRSRDQGCEDIAVADHDGVVLMDDRHQPGAEGVIQDRPGAVAVLRAGEVERGEEDLRRDQPSLAERRAEGPHEQALPHGSGELPGRRGVRDARRGQPGGSDVDGAGADEHGLDAVGAHPYDRVGESGSSTRKRTWPRWVWSASAVTVTPVRP